MRQQLLIRNTTMGMIWQVYNVESQIEIDMLTRTAKANGFQSFEVVPFVEGAYNETFPGWRDTESWKTYMRDELVSIARTLNQIQQGEPT